MESVSHLTRTDSSHVRRPPLSVPDSDTTDLAPLGVGRPSSESTVGPGRHPSRDAGRPRCALTGPLSRRLARRPSLCPCRVAPRRRRTSSESARKAATRSRRLPPRRPFTRAGDGAGSLGQGEGKVGQGAAAHGAGRRRPRCGCTVPGGTMARGGWQGASSSHPYPLAVLARDERYGTREAIEL